MTTTSVRCTPTLESISRMIHCEDVSVKFARRVEAILADPEILEAPSALHWRRFTLATPLPFRALDGFPALLTRISAFRGTLCAHGIMCTCGFGGATDLCR